MWRKGLTTSNFHKITPFEEIATVLESLLFIFYVYDLDLGRSASWPRQKRGPKLRVMMTRHEHTVWQPASTQLLIKLINIVIYTTKRHVTCAFRGAAGL
jgi:hypothetical protein